MKKVILSQNTKIAVFYDTLDNPEIENLVENSFGSITKGIINKEEKLFVKAGQYKISSSVKENKYITEDDEQSIKCKKIQNKHIENLGMNTDLSNVEITETENGTPVIKIDLDKKKNKKA
ncbi:hypothetical protein [Brachyspira pilosicoli]|uniref:hypothetical protein n=1 Tax=Brachyspira pilosicoli TaxID=52584 RepID=UPI0012F5026B|nr:hypothetical protein [Brachyspira pilosicoli]